MRINQEIQTILKTTWITYRKGAIAIFPRIELRELSDELKTYMENHNILYSVENHFILQKNPIKALQSLSNVELEKPVISEEELLNQFEKFWNSMVSLYNETCFIEKIVGKSYKKSINPIDKKLIKTYIEMYVINLYSFSQTFFNTEDFNNVFNTIEYNFDEFKKYLKINYSIEKEMARFNITENNNPVSIERNLELHQKNLDARLESFQKFFEVDSIESFTINHYRVFYQKIKDCFNGLGNIRNFYAHKYENFHKIIKRDFDTINFQEVCSNFKQVEELYRKFYGLFTGTASISRLTEYIHYEDAWIKKNLKETK